MTIMKKYYLLATALAALVSCSSDEFTGDPSSTPQGNSAIQFSSNAPKVTRTNSTDAAKLNYQFKVFGVKTPSSGGDQRVFATASSGVTPYDVWFVDNTASSTTSNSSNWEYVGTHGQSYGTTGHQVTLGSTDQTIKYWDYSATAYNFQAWSDLNTSENKVSVSAIDKNTMTISGTPAKLANLYIADLVTITSPTSGTTPSVVQFTFRKAATKVRLGIYETVPGYSVRNMKFYYTPKGSSETSSEATSSAASHAFLTGKFVGESTPSSATSFDVTYSGTPQKAVIKPSDSETTAKTEHFDFGTIGTDNTSVLGETSTSPTWAGGSAEYTSVFPNTESSNIADMTLKVDYELYNTASHEVIKVENKTAIVPAAYMTWKPNYAYTYLFKITDDLLTPITLDAIVVEADDGTQETITTVTEPSITTYAKASAVTTNGDYKDGEKIYATVMDGSSLATLDATNMKLYTVTTSDATNFPITGASVAEALIEGPTWTAAQAALKKITCTASAFTTYGKAVEAPDGSTLTMDENNNVVAAFTGDKTQIDDTPTYGPTYYAIVYQKTAATYSTDGGKNDYTSESFTAAGILYTNSECTTVAESWTSGTTYYKRTGVSDKGTYAVKIVKVVP